MSDTCPFCTRRRELDRHERLLRQEIDAAREALRFELPLDQRLDLVAEEHVLVRLLERIEERRFALSV
jgi:hypothetical protein